ncbi:MAG TPA: ferritin-like domain-containing protein [Gemmatimonadaceae bacterium]|nr:ferritin-like domain-containing protein [Gemmatimonadaceae bacterium]
MSTRRANARELISGLNEDLAYEYASVIQYRTYASTLRGPHRLTLRPMFAGEIPDELAHAGLLADAITAQGGRPTTQPASVPSARAPMEMLEQALQAERAAIARYVERREQAAAVGEHGLAVDLDTVIADETRHRDEMQLLLEDWDEGTRARESAPGRTRHESARRRPATADERSMAAKAPSP